MKFLLLFFSILFLFLGTVSAELRVEVADGFDYPVGKPDAKNYYKARGMCLRSPTHFGEDWNGTGGGNTLCLLMMNAAAGEE